LGYFSRLDTIELLINQQKLKATIILDFIHVLEYRWKGADCFETPGSEEVEEWVKERGAQILEGKSTDVAGEIKASAQERELNQKDQDKVDKCAEYWLKYSQDFTTWKVNSENTTKISVQRSLSESKIASNT
jgi:hypothetical protein